MNPGSLTLDSDSNLHAILSRESSCPLSSGLEMLGASDLTQLFVVNLCGWNMKCVSHAVVSDSLQPHGLYLARLLCPRDSPGRNTGVGCHSLLQEGCIIQLQKGTDTCFLRPLLCLSALEFTIAFVVWGLETACRPTPGQVLGRHAHGRLQVPREISG